MDRTNQWPWLIQIQGTVCLKPFAAREFAVLLETSSIRWERLSHVDIYWRPASKRLALGNRSDLTFTAERYSVNQHPVDPHSDFMRIYACILFADDEAQYRLCASQPCMDIP